MIPMRKRSSTAGQLPARATVASDMRPEWPARLLGASVHLLADFETPSVTKSDLNGANRMEVPTSTCNFRFLFLPRGGSVVRLARFRVSIAGSVRLGRGPRSTIARRSRHVMSRRSTSASPDDATRDRGQQEDFDSITTLPPNVHPNG
jgi:hypothetical protein